MMCGSETWCLRENEMRILKTTEKAIIGATCAAKLRKEVVKNLRHFLGLKKTFLG